MSAAATGLAYSRPVVLKGKYPEESVLRSIPLASVTSDGTPTRLAVASAPSGFDELLITGLALDADNAVMTIAGGQPGRIYSIRCGVTLDGGVVREIVATLTVSRVLLIDQPLEPGSEDFGHTRRWPDEPVAVYGESKYADGTNYGGPF